MSSDIESSLAKQREALKIVIQECSHKEKERLKRLAAVKRKSDQEQLLKRYVRERQVDQERIENLTQDYFNLQEKMKDGALNGLQEQRKNSGRRKEVQQELLPNRFVGLEDHNGQVVLNPFSKSLLFKFFGFRSSMQILSRNLIIMIIDSKLNVIINPLI